VSIALDPKTHKAKSVVCAALDNLADGFGSAGPLCFPRNLAGLMGKNFRVSSGCGVIQTWNRGIGQKAVRSPEFPQRSASRSANNRV